MGIFHGFHIEIFFRLNLEFLGNQIPSQKQFLEYKKVRMTFVWPRTTRSKFEAQELFFLCLGIRMGGNPKKRVGNERPVKLYCPHSVDVNAELLEEPDESYVRLRTFRCFFGCFSFLYSKARPWVCGLWSWRKAKKNPLILSLPPLMEEKRNLILVRCHTALKRYLCAASCRAGFDLNIEISYTLQLIPESKSCTLLGYKPPGKLC